MSKKLDEKLAQLKIVEQKFEKNRISTPKIQRVPFMLRRNDRFVKYCTPKMISFGPIHHGCEILKEGEHYKLLWTSKFIAKYNENQDYGEVTQVLLKRIEDNMEELKNEFADDVILEGKYDDNDLAWMLFVDGCSLLHFMENIDEQCPEALNLKLHQLLQIRRDTMLLENQLPRRLLEMLSKKEGPNLDFLFSNHSDFGESKHMGTIRVYVQNPKPIHILDYNHSAYLSPERVIHAQQDDGDEHNNSQIDPNGNSWYTYKNVRDLKRAGIRVIPNSLASNPYAWNDIHFKSKWFSGELRLPIFYFYDNTLYFFRNLIAYEMCPDSRSKYEFCSFISFMDSLIDNGEDVKELRLSGVFSNLLGSDEDLANLFNELGHDLPTNNYSDWCRNDAVAFSEKYVAVKQQIQKHYTTKWKTWLAEAYNTHFNTPWTIIAFFAALLIVILTFIQTFFTIDPR